MDSFDIFPGRLPDVLLSFPVAPTPRPDRLTPIARGKRAARAGILVNAGLAVFKLAAGIIGNSYALVADAIESGADIAASSIVLGGLKVAGREPDERYPFGYGKAETLAATMRRGSQPVDSGLPEKP